MADPHDESILAFNKNKEALHQYGAEVKILEFSQNGEVVGAVLNFTDDEIAHHAVAVGGEVELLSAEDYGDVLQDNFASWG